MSERRVRSRADMDPAYLSDLNTGAIAARTLTDALAIDHRVLLQSVLPEVGEELGVVVSEAQKLGILKRMMRIGTVLSDYLDEAEVARLSSHTSDTVRGWVCFLHVSQALSGPAALLDQLRVFADDEHFAVREWVWMAARPTLTRDLGTSIELLTGWTSDASERVRRFSSEVLRPRGVWAAHIPELKERPELGEPILHPLQSDPSSYVQDSVSNWINDAAKTCPDWAVDLCERWLAESDSAATVRIVKRALRSVGHVAVLS